MTERLYVRQVNESHWQWRLQYANGEWDEDVYAGTVELMAESLPQGNLPICLLVPGHWTVSRNEPADDIDQKHLAKVLPYEIEDEIIAPVDELHFGFGQVADDHVSLIYLETEKMNEALTSLAPTGCEVQQIYPDYLLLKQEKYAGILVFDGEQVLARFSDSLGFAIELATAPAVLSGLADRVDVETAALRLVAGSEQELEMLRSCLPREWLENEKLEIHQRIASYWDCLENAAQVLSLNLRTGAFARQLPLARWWSLWKLPAYVVAAGFVLSLGVNLGSYFMAKGESIDIRKEIDRVYTLAAPDGRKGDEENRLQNMLKSDGGNSNQPSNLMVLLSGFSKSMAAQSDVKLSNFRYNGDQRELQVNIEVKGLNELEQFREKLNGEGLSSEPPRTVRQGEVYQANMKIAEAN